MKIYNWRPFLDRWRADASAARDASGDEPVGPVREPGFPPADAARVGALEELLGAELPPSFRSFLAASDGWRPLGTEVALLGTADGSRWHEGAEPAELATGVADEDASGEQVPPARMWGRALQLAVGSDTTDVLLDPGDVDADGEWAAYLYRHRSGVAPERYASFLDLMQGLFRTAQRQWSDHLGAAYVSETTRELDTDTEDARLALLAGEDVDTWLPALSDAAEHGRPRARVLHAQVAALLDARPRSFAAVTAPGWMAGVASGWDDPLLVREFLPLAAWTRAGHAPDAAPDTLFARSLVTAAGEDGTDTGTGSGTGTEERVSVVTATLRAVRERTYRYEGAGGFGQAADAAREQARWGDTDGAWRTLAAALPQWEPYGEDQVAAVGLLADPVLGPLITPERGRLILETPTAGRRLGADAGAVTEDEGGGDPDGLTWLVDEDGQHPHGYRFLCVEGMGPAALADRLGGGPLPVPYGACDLSGARPAGDPAPVRLGHAGPGWGFAFDGAPTERFRPGRLAVPEEAASATGAGRALAVWVERDRGSDGPGGVFHFSAARDGRPAYGFTWRDGGFEQWGELPPGLDPRTLFPGAGVRTLDPDDEFEALLAIGTVFGISLPRFALTRGRLAATAPPAWLLPPAQDGPRLVEGQGHHAGR
ncbi:SMI1/KNR4 family protein [Streptomyces sp. NBC_01497]|uniref:SMI1/KNR4 family protein n=1 Tax=Streptomyces sp. NBC_01497 TaxID=2903885 RepID=UPI002E343458|nr:SMI1/KNR4 family protein [Streptomyces sp. NBC_01497]